jgi:hypothetical protein
VQVSRAARAVAAGVCWTLAVLSGVFTAGALAGGGVLCQAGQHRACKPATWLLVAGAVLTLTFGTAGALLWKPAPKRRQRRPWDYPS